MTQQRRVTVFRMEHRYSCPHAARKLNKQVPNPIGDTWESYLRYHTPHPYHGPASGHGCRVGGYIDYGIDGPCPDEDSPPYFMGRAQLCGVLAEQAADWWGAVTAQQIEDASDRGWRFVEYSVAAHFARVLEAQVVFHPRYARYVAEFSLWKFPPYQLFDPEPTPVIQFPVLDTEHYAPLNLRGVAA